MNLEILNQTLKEQAVELNACYKGISKMDKILSEEELIILWKSFFEFAIDNNFPSVPFIKENFNIETLHKNDVYVDEPVTLHNHNGIIAVNGSCSGTLMYDSFSCATIYVRHASDVTITAKGFSKIFIHTFDDSHVNIIQGELAKVFLYQHKNSTETHEGDINIRQK